jgi:hypothetical protein
MKYNHDVRFTEIRALLFLSVLFFSIAPVHATVLFTQTDELSCGDTKVKAFTTCTDEAGPPVSNCTEQRFLVVNRQTGASVKIQVSGRRSTERAPTALGGLAMDWACIRGKTGPYVIMGCWSGGNCETCEWHEVFDSKGRRVLTNKTDEATRTDRETTRFDRKWRLLGLPDPWPSDSFTPIKLRETGT